MKFNFCRKQFIYLGLAAISMGLALTTHVGAQEPEATSTNETIVTESEAGVEGVEVGGEESETETALESDEVVPIEVTSSPRVEDGVEGVELPARTQDRIINLARNMASRMLGATDRAGQIAERMESRIQKLNREGRDMTLAVSVLALAKNEIAEAEAILGPIDGVTVRAVTSKEPGVTFRELKDQFIAARDSVRDSYTHLRTVLQLLKDAPLVTPPEAEVIEEGDSEPEALNTEEIPE